MPEPSHDAIRNAALAEAADVCKQTAIRLVTGKRRVNQVDAHTADVLHTMEQRILALATPPGRPK